MLKKTLFRDWNDQKKIVSGPEDGPSPLYEIVPKNDVVGQDVDGGCLSGVKYELCLLKVWDTRMQGTGAKVSQSMIDIFYKSILDNKP